MAVRILPQDYLKEETKELPEITQSPPKQMR